MAQKITHKAKAASSPSSSYTHFHNPAVANFTPLLKQADNFRFISHYFLLHVGNPEYVWIQMELIDSMLISWMCSVYKIQCLVFHSIH